VCIEKVEVVCVCVCVCVENVEGVCVCVLRRLKVCVCLCVSPYGWYWTFNLFFHYYPKQICFSTWYLLTDGNNRHDHHIKNIHFIPWSPFFLCLFPHNRCQMRRLSKYSHVGLILFSSHLQTFELFLLFSWLKRVVHLWPAWPWGGRCEASQTCVSCRILSNLIWDLLCFLPENLSELRPKSGVDEDNTEAIFLLRYRVPSLTQSHRVTPAVHLHYQEANWCPC